MMRRLAVIALCLAVTLPSAASTQVLGGLALPPPPTASRDLQVFISPCGRPYRVAKGEPYPVALWFAEADTDRDGRLTELELRADALRFFGELDVNKSKLLEPDEVLRYKMEVAPEVLSAFSLNGATDPFGPARLWNVQQSSGSVWRGPKGNSAGTAPTRRLGSYSGSINGAARFMLVPRVDPVTSANVDMRIDIRPSDLAAQASRDFETLDHDHNGVLLLADLPPTMVQQRGQGR